MINVFIVCLIIAVFIVLLFIWILYLALWKVEKTKRESEKFRRI